MKKAEYKALLAKPKKNKFGAVKKWFNGRVYHSITEANYAMNLENKKKSGLIKDYIPQYSIRIDVNGIHICNYIIDFKIIMPDGMIEFHEVKGHVLSTWKLKWDLVHALYPFWKFGIVKNGILTYQ